MTGATRPGTSWRRPAAIVLDAGSAPHPPRPRWRDDGAAIASLRRAQAGPAAALATACLERGYPVEQEATIVEVVTRHLDGHAPVDLTV